jgi:hypothetical protein
LMVRFYCIIFLKAVMSSICMYFIIAPVWWNGGARGESNTVLCNSWLTTWQFLVGKWHGVLYTPCKHLVWLREPKTIEQEWLFNKWSDNFEQV